MKPWPMFAFIISFPVLFLLLFGQMDWMIVLGLVLPNPLGLALLLSKPQVGLPIALFWIYQTWNEKKGKGIIQLVTPSIVLFTFSFMAYGLWPVMSDPSIMVNTEHNVSMWPSSVPVGLVLLYMSIKNKKEEYALLSTPFLSPYIAPHSFSIALIGFAQEDIMLIIASISSWILLIDKTIK
jgi:hypothetical protein